MKRQQFREEQIIKILLEAGQSDQEIQSLSRQQDITEQAIRR